MADQSNALDVQQPVLQQAAQTNQAPLTDVRPAAPSPGISTNAPNGDFTGADATTAALLKLGSDVLAPKIKQAATEQFMQGVQQAASGEALTEIVKDKPWYTQIFGPSSAVQGARAYTTAQNVAQFGADMERQMPILAQKGPEALNAAMNASIQKQMTGDPYADQAIMSAYVDQMAPLAKRHATQHYIYLQKQASDQQVKAWDALADGYQTRAAAAADPAGGVSPADKEADAQRLLGAMIPFADQPDSSYEKNMTNFLQGAAAKGNFQVVSLFKDRGLLDKLPPENQAHLQTVFKTYARNALDKTIPQFAFESAMIMKDTAQDPRGVVARIAALNAKAAAVSGVPLEYGQMIPPQQTDNVVGSVLTAQAQARRAGIDDAAKTALANSLWAHPGSIKLAIDTGAVDARHMQISGAMLFNAEQDPVKRAAILNSQPQVQITSVAQQLKLPLQSEKYSVGIDATAKTFEAMSADTRAQYFNDNDSQFLTKFNTLAKSNMPPEAAYEAAKVLSPLERFQIDDKAKAGMEQGIRKYVESKHESWYGRNNVDDNGLRTIEALTAQTYKNASPILADDQKVATAMARAQAQGMQIIGSRVAVGVKGQQDIHSWMLGGPIERRVGADTTNEVFDQMMKDKAKEAGVKLDNYNLIRMADDGGEPRFLVEAYDADSPLGKSWFIRGAELRAKGIEAEDAKTRGRAPRGTQVVKPIGSTGAGTGAAATMGAGPGALSIPPMQ